MNTFLYLLLSLLTALLGFFTFRVIVRRDYQKKGQLSSFATLTRLQEQRFRSE
jgi:hypothetical protein